jgi:hypothetical protein
MMARVSPVATSRSMPRRISCSPNFFINPRTAIMGEDLLEPKGGLMEALRDVGASVIATHKLSTLRSQLSTAQYY